MSAEYVRLRYGVALKRGDRVAIDGRPGVVVSFPDQYLGIRFDDERHTSRAHPTWRVERLSDLTSRPEATPDQAEPEPTAEPEARV